MNPNTASGNAEPGFEVYLSEETINLILEKLK
jgi:hypothetical protein